MTLGEMFIKIGLKTSGIASQLNNLKNQVSNAGTAMEAPSKINSSWGKLSQALSNVKQASSNFFAGLKQKGSQLLSFATDLKASHAVIVSIAAAIVTVVKKTSDVAAGLTKFTNLTGLSSQKLQALSQQAALSGVSMEDVAGSLSKIQQSSMDIALGKGKGIAPWAMLGIDPHQDPFKVLQDLQNSVNKFSPARFASLLREIGLSDDMINFIREAKSLGASDRGLLLSDKEIKRLKEFNISFNRALDNSKRSLQKLAISIKPIADSLIYAWNRFNITMTVVASTIDYLAGQFQFLFKLISVIGAAILIAFFPLTATVILLALALDDLAAWARGDDSIMGTIVGKFSLWRQEIERIIKLFKDVQDALKGMFSIQAWKDFFTMPQGIGQPLGAANVAAYAAQDKENNAKNWEKFKEFFGFGTKEVTVNINGVTDPLKAGQVVKEALDKDNRDTMYQQKSGVVK